MNQLYLDDLLYLAKLDLPWDKLNSKNILITGASGLIGNVLVDLLMYRNDNKNQRSHIFALGRNEQKAKKRFLKYWDREDFTFIAQDISDKLERSEQFDYILHLASNTHPVSYSTEPISTITTNLLGTNNLLDYGIKHGCSRFLLASSNEIYGENRGDVELFDESYCGYIDSNTLRAGYPESKRCSEALCQAYKKEFDMDIVIPRLTRSFGATLLDTDSKALSQFLKKGLAGEDIVLKSAGMQYYSYTYVVDAVAGILTVLLKGENGEAYNIADEPGDIRLKDLAELIANACGKQVVFELPDDIEKAGYSTATKARLDGSKIKNLGWHMEFSIKEGIERTIQILKSV